MSNIEIVRLKACIRQDFEVKWVKNDKYTKKHSGKTNVYVYEAYFFEKSRLFLKKTSFSKVRTFSTGEIFETCGIF